MTAPTESSPTPVHDSPRIWVIVPAAGVGSRMGAEIPKQYLELNGKTVLQQTLDRLLTVPEIERVLLPVSETDAHWAAMASAYAESVIPVAGGKERSDSVFNALGKIADQASDLDWVLVHDVARPCLRRKDIQNLIKTLQSHPVGGLLAVPVADTMKQADAHGKVIATVPRERLWRAYTPQMFRFGLLWRGLQEAADSGVVITDEASAIEYLGHQPLLVQGHSDNIKITHPQDLSLAAMFLERIDQEEA